MRNREEGHEQSPTCIGVWLALLVTLASTGVVNGCRTSSSELPIAEAARGVEPTALEPVPPSALCVGAGRIERPVRAVIAGDHSRRAELAFTYRGPSSSTAALANGEVRRQIGLKLRAQDTCNVIYVMWHVEPSPGVFVSVKRNAGSSSHSECGAGGYDNLKPTEANAAPAIEPNAPHVLAATLDGATLLVTADGNVVWRGELPGTALAFDGPVGLRSDNGAFDFELRVPGGGRAADPCR